jgi:hypothetical protein
MRSGGKPHACDRGFEQTLPGVVELTMMTNLPRVHPRVGKNAGAAEALLLGGPCGHHTLANLRRPLDGFAATQFGVLDGGNVDMNVDAVQQRPRDFGQVSRDDRRRAAAFAGGIVIEPAGTSLRCLSAMSA